MDVWWGVGAWVGRWGGAWHGPWVSDLPGQAEGQSPWHGKSMQLGRTTLAVSFCPHVQSLDEEVPAAIDAHQHRQHIARLLRAAAAGKVSIHCERATQGGGQ